MPLRIYFFLGLVLAMSPLYAQDSTKASADLRYNHPNSLEWVFIGTNNRKIWSMPVQAKVFQLDREKGGLTIKELGGGMQTKSLKLEDKKGRKWVLRSLSKTVDKAMVAEGIKSGFIRNISQDMISAAQPYGSLTITPMAKALGLLNPEPELFFVPDDTLFGPYQSMFANTMCTLEEREPLFYPGDSLVATEVLERDLEQHKNYHLDEKMLLQARLLDMLISDWDRHAAQWKWEYHPVGSGMVIYPVPYDHDQAYFTSNGLLVKMVRPFTMHHLIGFRNRSTRLKALNRKEWIFDRLFLSGLSEDDWRDGIHKFQSRLTDSVLSEAVHRLPDEIYRLTGEKYYRRLRNRRDTMPKYVMRYYHFLKARSIKPLPPPKTIEPVK